MASQYLAVANRRERFLRLLTAAAATLLIQLAMAPLAYADGGLPVPPVTVTNPVPQKDGDALSVSPNGRMDPEQPLDEVATALEQLVSEQQFTEFTGTAVDLDRRTVQLYWHGPVPRLVTELIDHLAIKAAVEVRPSLYSRATLLAEEMRLLRDKSLGRSVNTVAALPDFSGLQVVVDPGTTFDIPSSVPTTVAESVRAQAFSCPNDCAGPRWNDAAPFYAGDAVRQNAYPNAVCSTAFEAFRASDGVAFMLAAAHCGLNSSWNTPPSSGSHWVGNSGSCCSTLDATTITQNTGFTGTTYTPRIWVGPYNSPNGRPVVALTSNPMGAGNRCMSGAFSGEVCNNKVTSQLVSVDYGDGTGPHGPGVWMEQQQHVPAAGFGDSGGPVYTVAPVTGDVTAAGIINGGDNLQGSCTGIPGGNLPWDRKCSWHIFVLDIGTVLNALNLGLVVSNPTLSPLGDTLTQNHTLSGGQYLSSGNGRYDLLMQFDGNLVLYSPTTYLWASWSQNHYDDYALMQADGNLVIYRQGGSIHDWSSGTTGNPSAYLVMQTDGNLVIYRQGGIPIWSTNTCCG